MEWLNNLLGDVLAWFESWTGSYALVLLFYALILKILFLPFTVKQQKNQIKMAKIAPKIEAIKASSLEILTGCKLEQSLKDAKAPSSYQFMRLGYFCPDSKDSSPEHLVFNRSVSLKDSFKPGK